MNPRAPHNYDCRICRQDHPLRKCLKFGQMNIPARHEAVKRFAYCGNCLAHSHQTANCHSLVRCHHCGERHHTLLHRSKDHSSPSGSIPVLGLRGTNVNTATAVPTVVIQMLFGDTWRAVRGLLNPGVAVSSIAGAIPEKYGLPVKRSDADQWCTVSFRSRFQDGPTLSLTARVTRILPRQQQGEAFDPKVADCYANLRLADPNFYAPRSFSIVLGADVYPILIRPGIQPSTTTSPMAQDTLLGWVIIGGMAN